MIPSVEPLTCNAGDTLKWTKDFGSDYPSSTYTLAYVFRSTGNAAITISATTSGNGFTITVPGSTTSTFATGVVYWTALATSSGQRFTVGDGQIQVSPDPSGTATYDPRSTVKQIFDAIEATILGSASSDDQAMMVDGMSLQRRSLDELHRLRNKYYTLWQNEVNADRVANGLGNRRKIYTRFTSP